MQQLKRLLKCHYRIYFTTVEELNSWLKARSYMKWLSNEKDLLVYYNKKLQRTLKVDRRMFDEEGKLKVFTNDEWDECKITLEDQGEEEVASTTLDE